LWRLKKGRFELIKIIPCHTLRISYVLLALTNGNVACTSGYDGTIEIWNLYRDVMVHKLCDHASDVSQLVLLSNGNLASLSIDDTVTVWNAESGQRLNKFTFKGLSKYLPFIALPNELFATVDSDSRRNISIFNSNTGELVKSLIGHEKGVWSLVLLNDTHMASSSLDYDGTIKIWALASGHVVRSINTSNMYLALLSDDVLACYPYLNNPTTTIELWKWKMGELWKTIEVNRERVTWMKALLKSPDDQQRLIYYSCYENLPAQLISDI
jgi:WD40 repeat protein